MFWKILMGILSLILIPFANTTFSQELPLKSEGPSLKFGPQDKQELEAFLDGIIAAQREAHHIEGITVAVVKDGELFFSKGYGYADIANGKRVEPEKTLFRI